MGGRERSAPEVSGRPVEEERPPAARRPVPPAGSTAAGWATDRQHARSPPENARAPVGLLAGGGERRSTDAGCGADERRHAGFPRRGVRQGLGDRRRPRRHLPGQHLPGLQLGLEHPVRADRRRRALRGARPDLRRPVPGRRRREAERLASGVLGLALAIMAVVSIVGVVFASPSPGSCRAAPRTPRSSRSRWRCRPSSCASSSPRCCSTRSAPSPPRCSSPSAGS